MQPLSAGKSTSEFKLTAFTAVIGPIVALLVAYGIISAEQGDLWAALAVALIGVLAPAISAAAYSLSRARVKAAYFTSNPRSNNPRSISAES